MINWPDSLVKDLAEGRCVIFLGSGISSNAQNARGERPKTWRSLLEKATGTIADSKKKKVINSCLNRYDYLMACELIKAAMGDDSFSDFLRDEFQTPRFLPADIHKDIFKLDAPVVITPNFDKIYDTYVSTETGGETPVLNYYSNDIIDNIRNGKLMVLKIHGTIDERSRLIFTKKDYAKARNENLSFYKLLEALILTRTFLFLGAGLNDPDIQLLLENNNFQYAHTRKHFFVIHDKEYSNEELAVYSSTLNLSFLKYNWNTRTKSHQDFLDSVKDLQVRVELAKNRAVPPVI